MPKANSVPYPALPPAAALLLYVGNLQIYDLPTHIVLNHAIHLPLLEGPL